MSTPTTTTTLVTTSPAPAESALPSEKTLKHAARIAIDEDKPIMLDYYNDTHAGRAFLGEDPASKQKMLVRSEEEYTSIIQKIFKVNDDFIVMTENSIYIVSGLVRKKTISAPAS
jgi:hypothetical protein